MKFFTSLVVCPTLLTAVTEYEYVVLSLILNKNVELVPVVVVVLVIVSPSYLFHSIVSDEVAMSVNRNV